MKDPVILVTPVSDPFDAVHAVDAEQLPTPLTEVSSSGRSHNSPLGIAGVESPPLKKGNQFFLLSEDQPDVLRRDFPPLRRLRSEAPAEDLYEL